MDRVNRSVVNTNVAWANSSAINTEKTVDFDTIDAVDAGGKWRLDLTIPDWLLSLSGKYLVLVQNPSGVTALTVKVQTLWDDDASTERVADLRDGTADKSLAVPTASTKGMVFEGFVAGKKARISLKNDVLLGVGDGFTARVQVRAI